jgi:hypothetical protein
MLSTYNRISKQLTFLFCLILLGSCKKDDDAIVIESEPPAITGIASIHVENKVGNDVLRTGLMCYQNASGDSFQVDLLKYYIGRFEWLRADGTSYKTDNYQLINASNLPSLDFQLANIPNGTYTGVRFNLGVDSISNHTFTNYDALDASSGMIWSWNTGYIFFKHEGRFVDSLNATKPLLFHYGTDRGFTQIQLPLDNLVINANTRNLQLTFDLGALYREPTPIDFNSWNNNQSLTTQEYPWIDAMRYNFGSSFSINIQ